jgi:hypothetical protein
MQQQLQEEKSFQLLLLLEEEVRRSGGKALLSREEYLEILSYCYRQVYGQDSKEQAKLASSKR